MKTIIMTLSVLLTFSFVINMQMLKINYKLDYANNENHLSFLAQRNLMLQCNAEVVVMAWASQQLNHAYQMRKRQLQECLNEKSK